MHQNLFVAGVAPFVGVPLTASRSVICKTVPSFPPSSTATLMKNDAKFVFSSAFLAKSPVEYQIAKLRGNSLHAFLVPETRNLPMRRDLSISCVWRDVIAALNRKATLMLKEAEFREQNGYDSSELRSRIPALMRELSDTLRKEIESLEKRMYLMKKELDYLEEQGMDSSRYREGLKVFLAQRAEFIANLKEIEGGTLTPTRGAKREELGKDPEASLKKMREDIEQRKSAALEKARRLDSMQDDLEDLEDELMKKKAVMDELAGRGEDTAKIRELLIGLIQKRKTLISTIKALEKELESGTPAPA